MAGLFFAVGFTDCVKTKYPLPLDSSNGLMNEL